MKTSLRWPAALNILLQHVFYCRHRMWSNRIMLQHIVLACYLDMDDTNSAKLMTSTLKWKRILRDKDKQRNWRRMIREDSIFEKSYYLHHHIPGSYSEFACHCFILIRTTMTSLKADGSCHSDLQRRRREHDRGCLENNHCTGSQPPSVDDH